MNYGRGGRHTVRALTLPFSRSRRLRPMLPASARACWPLCVRCVVHPSEGSVTIPPTVFEQQAEKRYLAPPPSSLVAVTLIDCLRIHIHPRRDCIIDLRSRSLISIVKKRHAARLCAVENNPKTSIQQWNPSYTRTHEFSQF